MLVIDSGLDITHADFADRPACCWRTRSGCARPTDGEWHGTAVSSTIAAARNNIGMAGLYPTVRLGIWDGGGDGILTSETINALRRAAQRHYRVVNMSFGGEGFTLPELLACTAPSPTACSSSRLPATRTRRATRTSTRPCSRTC